jgi:HAD superfamily hydrolase (TIGR01509 family)
MRRKSVIFDLGGVLIDYDNVRTISASAALLGLSPEEFSASFGRVSRSIGTGVLDSSSTYQLAQSESRRSDLTFDAFAAAFCAGMARNDEAIAYALALENRPEVDIGIISNTNALHVHWLEENVPEFDQFELILYSNEVQMLKPEPDIYRLALELLDLPPRLCLFIDDVADNVVGAQFIGMAGHLHTGNWVATRHQIEAFLAEG